MKPPRAIGRLRGLAKSSLSFMNGRIETNCSFGAHQSANQIPADPESRREHDHEDRVFHGIDIMVRKQETHDALLVRQAMAKRMAPPRTNP
jgi:hypothetical protein